MAGWLGDIQVWQGAVNMVWPSIGQWVLIGAGTIGFFAPEVIDRIKSKRSRAAVSIAGGSLLGYWLTQEDMEGEIERSTAFMNRVTAPGAIPASELRHSRNLAPVDQKTAVKEISERYGRELVWRMRREFAAAHPEACLEDRGLYQEDTLRAWLDGLS